MLIWAKYKKGSGFDHALFFHLATEEGKTYLLKSEQLNDEQIRVLNEQKEALTVLPLAEKLQWVKHEMPDAYNKAIRVFRVENVVAVKSMAKP